MRFSDVVGPEFFHIGLAPEDQKQLDIFYAAACHHFYRWRESRDEFHLTRHLAHLRHLMQLVYERGDFKNALDLSLRNLDDRETWNPAEFGIPYSGMFEELYPDPKYAVGEAHEFDAYLKNMLSPEPRKTDACWLQVAATA